MWDRWILLLTFCQLSTCLVQCSSVDKGQRDVELHVNNHGLIQVSVELVRPDSTVTSFLSWLLTIEEASTTTSAATDAPVRDTPVFHEDISLEWKTSDGDIWTVGKVNLTAVVPLTASTLVATGEAAPHHRTFIVSLLEKQKDHSSVLTRRLASLPRNTRQVGQFLDPVVAVHLFHNRSTTATTTDPQHQLDWDNIWTLLWILATVASTTMFIRDLKAPQVPDPPRLVRRVLTPSEFEALLQEGYPDHQTRLPNSTSRQTNQSVSSPASASSAQVRDTQPSSESQPLDNHTGLDQVSTPDSAGQDHSRLSVDVDECEDAHLPPNYPRKDLTNEKEEQSQEAGQSPGSSLVRTQQQEQSPNSYSTRTVPLETLPEFTEKGQTPDEASEDASDNSREGTEETTNTSGSPASKTRTASVPTIPDGESVADSYVSTLPSDSHCDSDELGVAAASTLQTTDGRDQVALPEGDAVSLVPLRATPTVSRHLTLDDGPARAAVVTVGQNEREIGQLHETPDQILDNLVSSQPSPTLPTDEENHDSPQKPRRRKRRRILLTQRHKPTPPVGSPGSVEVLDIKTPKKKRRHRPFRDSTIVPDWVPSNGLQSVSVGFEEDKRWNVLPDPKEHCPKKTHPSAIGGHTEL